MGGVAHWPERSVERTIEKGLGSIPSTALIFFFFFFFFFNRLRFFVFYGKTLYYSFHFYEFRGKYTFFSFTYFLFILSFGYNEISIA